MKRHLRKCSAALILAAAFLLSLWLPGTTAAVRAETAAPEKPAAVGSARANIVTVKWEKVPGASGYELFKLNSDRKFHWFKSFGSNTTAFKVRGKYNLTYQYRLRSFTRVNGKKVYSGFCKVTVKTAPASGTNITSTSRDKSDSGIVRWKENSYADGYEIYRSSTANGSYQKIATIDSSSIHAVRDTRLVTNKSYYYKVRAYTKNSDSVAYGRFGKSKSLEKYSDEESPAITGAGRKLLVVGDSRVLFMSNWCQSAGVSYIARSRARFSQHSTAIRTSVCGSGPMITITTADTLRSTKWQCRSGKRRGHACIWPDLDSFWEGLTDTAVPIKILSDSIRTLRERLLRSAQV